MPISRLRWLPRAVCAIAVAFACVGETPAIVPIDGGTPIVYPLVINATAGDQYQPHVSGDLVSYTSDSNIRYYDFFSGADVQVPSATYFVDFFNSVSDGKIVFSRQSGLTGAQSIVVYDVAAGTTSEIDPQPFPQRGTPSIGDGTVAFIDLFAQQVDLVIARPGGATVRVTTDTRLDDLPVVAPSGSVVVYESCVSSPNNCDVRQAAWNGTSWIVTPLTSTPEPEANAKTDGTIVVYDATRAGESDIYWQPVGGGPEQRLDIPGAQRHPSVRNGVILFESVAVGETAADLWVYRIDTNRLYRITSTPSDEELSDLDMLPDGRLRVVWNSGGLNPRDVFGATVELPACVSTPEVCDGIDNDCDGLVDEGMPLPTSRPQIAASKLQPGGTIQLAWSAASDATGYDVVRGVLSTLRASQGDFSTAVDSCLQNDASQPHAEDAATPPASDGLWYLVRSVNACSTEPGTYDDYWVPSQVGYRDNEIDAAAQTCPY